MAGRDYSERRLKLARVHQVRRVKTQGFVRWPSPSKRHRKLWGLLANGASPRGTAAFAKLCNTKGAG